MPSSHFPGRSADAFGDPSHSLDRRALRQSVISLLQRRFDPLPPAMTHRVEAANDPDALRRAFEQAFDVAKPEDLSL